MFDPLWASQALHMSPCPVPSASFKQMSLPVPPHPHLALGCSRTSTGPPALLAPHGGSPFVGLWRGEGYCWHGWEDVGITAPLGEGRLLHAMAAYEKRSSLLCAAQGSWCSKACAFPVWFGKPFFPAPPVLRISPFPLGTQSKPPAPAL